MRADARLANKLDRALRALQGPASLSEITALSLVPPRDAAPALARMMRAGLAQRVRRGVYVTRWQDPS